jgi:hypothetical protein
MKTGLVRLRLVRRRASAVLPGPAGAPAPTRGPVALASMRRPAAGPAATLARRAVRAGTRLDRRP